jgi:hypothetical protein
MKRILLAVITEGDHCVAPFCSSLVQSTKLGLGNDIELFPVFFDANGNWSMAFNQAVTLAWKEKLDGFLCISPRVSWEAESLFALVNSDKDAVTLPVATRNGFKVKLGEIARLQEDGSEIKVQGASLDFIYLSSYAIERLCQTHPLVDYYGSQVKLILQSGDIYATYFDPGDILTYRLREQGIELWVNYKHTAHRQDSIEYLGSFDEALTQLKANG